MRTPSPSHRRGGAHRVWVSLLLAAAAAWPAAGCTELSGPDLDRGNPNAPARATINQLLTGVTSFSTTQLTGDFNRAVTIWMQQMAGTGRQWLNIDAPYVIDENSFGDYGQFYAGGGLADIRRIQELARASNDSVYLGVAQVWEALVMHTVADLWGDVPYREAARPAEFPTPALDPQEQVYADLQELLDEAIVNLGGGGNGPGTADLIYGGDADRWTALAHTLKARLYLRTAERNPAAYALALAEANQGISDASGDGDFLTFQSSTVGERNQWFQFRDGRGTDISAASFMVELMRARNGGAADPRLTQYFGRSGDGTILGADPGEEGSDFSWLSPVRAVPGFRQPLVTWAENQLIKAEALLQTGDLAGAAAALNAEREQAGLAPVSAALPRNALYQQIMEEKYVALFQNMEVWSDYKRTCWPNLAPANDAVAIPARMLYGANELSTNPNIPVPAQQPRRNWNDPANATSLDGSACLGQPE